jgi:hypothetical protein
MRSRLIAVSVLSLAGVAFFMTTRLAQAIPVNNLHLAGMAVAGAPVSFTVTGALPSSSVRIVVIPGGLAALSGPAPLVAFGCYSGTPAALGTADATTDASGNVGPTLVWASATPGQYTAYLLQGSCAGVSTGGRTMQASTDTRIVAADGFTIGESVPALSTWGFAALGLALSIAGWAFLSRTRA